MVYTRPPTENLVGNCSIGDRERSLWQRSYFGLGGREGGYRGGCEDEWMDVYMMNERVSGRFKGQSGRKQEFMGLNWWHFLDERSYAGNVVVTLIRRFSM